ncbi:MAG: hypothetical protein ACI4RD_00560 [Kiritimatiellia bacterium]
MPRICSKLTRTANRLRRNRWLGCLFLAVGSGRFWAVTALAATVAAVSVVLYVEIHADPGDAGSYGYQTLGRERVLLMNVDNNAACPVTFESYAYNQTASPPNRRKYEAFWTFVETDTVSLYNLKANASTELHVANNGVAGERLWSLRNCRHGNTYSSDAEFQKVSNYLPISATSLGIGSTSTAASNKATDATAGQIVMQNTPEAEVISSCYPEGIGTVYFDAVNAFTGYKNGQIAVEVAYGVFKTNSTGQVVSQNIPDDLERDADGNFVPPDDAHCDEVRYIEQTASSEVTETTPFGRVAWVRVNLTGAWSCNGATGTVPTNTVLELKMPESGTAAGTKENFYRVWAPVADLAVNPAVAEQARGPMRFRLRRIDNPNATLSGISSDGENLGTSASAQQKNALLLVDNVIASYPAMKAWAIPAESRYVSGGSARNVIGWTGALDTRYAAVGARGLRATAELALATNAVPGVSDEWVAGVQAVMSWRWRYMNQAIGEWETLTLARQGDRLVSEAAFDLPDTLGDIEFRYETVLDAPYYAYLDYSGSTALTGTPGYSERIARVSSRLNPGARGQTGGIPALLPSRGDDFFFRLREGASDQLEFRLDVRLPGSTATLLTEPCWLTGDGVWRTYLRTTTNAIDQASIRNQLPRGTYEFRIRGVDTNVTFAATAAVTAIPVSAQRLLAGDAWARLDVDAATDALRFELFEDATSPEVMTFSIVHASFQDFNLWSDAINDDKTYTGAYFEGRGKQSGSSPDTREYPSELAGWNPLAAANDAYWREEFTPDPGMTPLDGYNGYRAYVGFARSATPNGWTAVNSMWVCGKYRESAKDGDMALQLGGWGDGSLEYVNSARLPRGIESIAFKARVAQEQTFDGFAYYFGDALKNLKDYLVTVRAALSTTAASTMFDGNGSVSIVGYYQPGEGCYELRAERVADNTVRLYLYKWSRDQRSVKAKLLGYHANTLAYTSQTYLRCSNSGQTATDQSNAYYGELFMRCQTVNGQAVITAGIMNGQKKLADSGSGVEHYYFTYTDTDADNALTFGTYGFSSLNAPAQIVKPQFYANGAGGTFPAVSGLPRDEAGNAINLTTFRCGKGNVTYPSGAVNAFINTSGSKYEDWVFSSGIFETAEVGGYKAIRAIPPTGEVEAFVTPVGGTEEAVGTVTVNGFRTADCELPVRNTQEVLVRIATGPDSGDVVVDNVRFGQWCAANYDDTNSRGDFSNTDFDDKLPGLGCPTNYVYLNGWVQVAGEGRTLGLQPLRATYAETTGDRPVGFRTPLMDGRDGRGIGLGMISYTYRDADPRCRLLVQYRSDIDGTSYLRTRTAALDGWTTVATNDFSAADAATLAEGTVTAYVGQHGASGAMRVIVDPQVVKDAQNATKNPSRDPAYGQITITGFRASDEPPLYGLYWWGWNLRTSDDEAELSFYDSDPTAAGLSVALNNSVTADTEPWSPEETEDDRRQRFAQHVPFVQSPTFYTNLVNEVSFRARKLLPDGPATEIAILGAVDAGVSQDTEWRHLKTIVVDSASFETYAHKVKASEGFRSFRLAVIGVAGVETNWADEMEIPIAQRILLDEVSVSEGIYGKIGLFDIGAFRSPMDEHVYVPNVASDLTQQPMCEEAWSVQCEVRAVQLADEILLDDDTEVWLHWYVGTDRWGYGRWSDAAKSAKLARVEGQPGFVYRGSYAKAAGAVVDPIYDSGAVVQYMLEVRYKNADGTDADPYFMTAGDWHKPDWYRGVDYNARYGGFAGYTILDYVAYGYAWINEVNLFDIDRDASGPSLYVDPMTNQFVEVAVPAEANIAGWKLQFITGGLSDSAELYTNTVVTFSDPAVIPNGVPCKKTLNMDPGSKYVFITAGSPKSCSDELKAKGFIDGPWRVDSAETYGSQLKSDGSVDIGMPLGVRLVRPSGIVEHQIVVAGTNRYATYRQPYPRTYSATNFVAKLNAFDADRSWYTPWCEDRGTNATLALGVTTFDGVTTDANVWAHLGKTPGRINLGEYIPSEHPHPMGAMFVLYAQLEGGFIEQTVGSEGPTTNNLVLYVRKGLPDGTNIVYDLAAWHELESITETTEGRTTVHPGPAGHPRRYEFRTRPYASNDLTVVAKTCVRKDLTGDYGLTADNAYTPAVLAWLARGSCGKTPAPFANPGGEIRLAEAHDFADNYVCDLSLTEMYWLDMDPTVGGTVLQAGMSAAPYPVEVVRSGAGGAAIQCRDGVVEAMMKIYSQTGAFAPYAPYTLNGIAPGSSSRTSAAGWNSATFKVTFHLLNGQDDMKDPDMIWMPVRYFVFDDNSFGPDFKAKIQVVDPFYQFSDWEEWKDRLQPGEDLMYKFTIDTRKFGAVGNDVLRPDSTYP